MPGHVPDDVRADPSYPRSLFRLQSVRRCSALSDLNHEKCNNCIGDTPSTLKAGRSKRQTPAKQICFSPFAEASKDSKDGEGDLECSISFITPRHVFVLALKLQLMLPLHFH